MNKIKWIFFDIGSTLVDESVAFRKRVEKTVANTNVSYDDFYNKMVEISKQDLHVTHPILNIRERNYFVFRVLSIDSNILSVHT